MSVLETIGSPADLRQLDAGQLVVLAAEIRDFLVASVLETGGHLGSNLGVVELTLALHRVFDSPRDAILWDTGHQSYVHKLVTGRRDRFVGLRRRGGLSGYPSRAESSHDWIENSHASTGLSYACGLALARRLRGDAGRVVVVVGDGALTGGMAYEALNNIGYREAPVTIVLNDNGRSYAPTISRLCESLKPDDAAAGPAFFEALGIEHRGPVDGHDMGAVEEALRATPADRPVVVHTVTRKGAGYRPAEDDAVKRLHDVPPRPRPTPPGAPAPLPRYTEVFASALVAAARRDASIVAITAAMPDSTGLLAFAGEFPDRVFDVGIAEQHAITSACGLAMGGMHPVVAVYSSFLTRAFDQVNLDIGLHRLPVVLCVDRAGITGPDGASHHGLLDLMLLTKVPGMVVYAPSSAQELRVMLADALDRPGPCALRWPNAAARLVADGEVGAGLHGRRVRRGRNVCLLAVGRTVEAAERAADLLAVDGISATVWDVRVVSPLDREMLDDAARHHLVVTVEDGSREGGAGSAIAAALGRGGGRRRVPRVAIIGVPVAFVGHGDQETLLAELGLDAGGLASTVAAMVRPGARITRLAVAAGDWGARPPLPAGARGSS